jgi:hypothetical protein
MKPFVRLLRKQLYAVEPRHIMGLVGRQLRVVGGLLHAVSILCWLQWSVSWEHTLNQSASCLFQRRHDIGQILWQINLKVLCMLLGSESWYGVILKISDDYYGKIICLVCFAFIVYVECMPLGGGGGVVVVGGDSPICHSFLYRLKWDIVIFGTS